MQDYVSLGSIELRRKATEALPLLGRRIQAFRDTLASYLIPEDGIEKYTVEFMKKRQGFMNDYTRGKLSERSHDADIAALVIVEIAFLDSSVPGELNIEELTPIARDYLRGMIRAQVELMQKASDEYLK